MSVDSKYEGQWVDNKMNDHGAYTLSNGSKCDDKLSDGEKLGKNQNQQTKIIHDNQFYKMFSNNS